MLGGRRHQWCGLTGVPFVSTVVTSAPQPSRAQGARDGDLYGVLRGRPDRYKREDNASTPHLQIRVLEERPAVADCRERAVRHRSDVGVLGGRPARGPSPAGVAAGARRRGSAPSPPMPTTPWTSSRRRCSTGRSAGRCRRPAARAATTCRICCPCISTSARPPAARSTRSAPSSIRTCTSRSTPSSATLDGLHGIHDIHLNQGNVGRTPGTTACFTTAGSSSRSPIGISVSSSASRPSASRPTLPVTPRPVSALSARSSPAGRPRRRRSCPTVYIERALINPSGADTGQRDRGAREPLDDRADAHELAAAGQERARDDDQHDDRARAVRRASRSTAPACSSGTRAAT